MNRESVTDLREVASLSVDEWERRKAFVGFGPDDVMILRELHLVAKTYANDVMTELYERWLRFAPVRAFFEDPERLTRVKGLQKQYFIQLTGGDYGPSYLADRLHIGHVHRRIGLDPELYMGACSIYLQIVIPRILAAFEYDRGKRDGAVAAIIKIVSLDQGAAMTAYFAVVAPVAAAE